MSDKGSITWLWEGEDCVLPCLLRLAGSVVPAVLNKHNTPVSHMGFQF